jgi:hypothetical protein
MGESEAGDIGGDPKGEAPLFNAPPHCSKR